MWDSDMTPVITVAQTRDGIWHANERGPARVAIAYFPTKFGAIKHALRCAYMKREGCTVRLLQRNGQTAAEKTIRLVPPLQDQIPRFVKWRCSSRRDSGT